MFKGDLNVYMPDHRKALLAGALFVLLFLGIVLLINGTLLKGSGGQRTRRQEPVGWDEGPMEDGYWHNIDTLDEQFKIRTRMGPGHVYVKDPIIEEPIIENMDQKDQALQRKEQEKERLLEEQQQKEQQK